MGVARGAVIVQEGLDLPQEADGLISPGGRLGRIRGTVRGDW